MGHFIFRSDPKSQTLVWDLINFQNVLNHMPSHWQTQKNQKKKKFYWLIPHAGLYLCFWSVAIIIPL